MISLSLRPHQPSAWITVCASRWWYLLPLLDLPITLLHQRTLHYLLVIITLSIGIGLFIIPSLASTSAVARGWRWMIVSWGMLIIRQGYFIATQRDGLVYSVYDYVHLIVVYTPPIIFIARTFYSLPFKKRSKLGTTMDWLLIGSTTTILLAQLLNVTILDTIFVGGDLAGLYAIFLNYQQRPAHLQGIFLRCLKAMLVIILSDLLWVVFSTYNLPVLSLGPLHIFSWLYLSRVALASPSHDEHITDQQGNHEPFIQQTLGFLFLIVALIFSLASHDDTASGFLVVLAFLIFTMETWENSHLHRRLDRAREQEHRLRLAADEARTEEAWLRQFIQSLGHDLKAPVARIDVCLEELRFGLEEDRNYQHHRYLDAIDQARDVLHRRISIMLDVARKVQAGLIITPVSFSTLEAEAMQNIPAIQRTYKATHIPVSFDYPPGTLQADSAALGRALENLVVNAIKAQAQQITSSVMVSIQSDEVATIISVVDDGPGFEPARLNQRETNDLPQKRAKGSHGLGLLGVQAVVQALGGTVNLENRHPGGAQVTITLPKEDHGHPDC